MSDGSKKKHRQSKSVTATHKRPLSEEERTARRRRRKERRARHARKEARRAARHEAKRQAKAEQRGKSKSSDFLDRRAAGMMRFLFDWAQAVGRVRASNIAARVTRFGGRFVKENKLGAANLAAAFPEKSEAERAQILGEVWDNLARQAIEYAFLKDMIDAFDPAHMEDGPVEIVGIEHIHALRDSGKAGVIFGAL